MLYKWRFNNTLNNGDKQLIQPLIPNNGLFLILIYFKIN
jgi:hypothetical protein